MTATKREKNPSNQEAKDAAKAVPAKTGRALARAAKSAKAGGSAALSKAKARRKQTKPPVRQQTSNVYSGIDELPTGFASENLTPGCLVLEGGAFRGLYSGGVIDALMDNDINLQAICGVSAGALYGFCYTGAQRGSARINLRYRHDSRYVGTRALRKNQGIMGWDFLFGRVELQSAEERRRFYDDRRRFAVVATNVDTGCAEYLEKGDADHRGCADIVAATCASASMPYVSQPVWVGANRYLDGGCADKIPFQWAIDEGYQKIIVIRTREKGFRKPESKNTPLAAHARYGRDFPAFAEALGASDHNYNLQCDQLEKLEEQGRVKVIYPSQPVDVARLEGDMEKLGQLYHLGYDDTMAQMDDIKAYLGIE